MHLIRLCMAIVACGVLMRCGNPGSGVPAEPPRTRLLVGFSQIGAESAWRAANSKSIKDAAAARDIDLRFTDAQGSQENQLRAIRTFIQQNVDVIAFSPVVETGWTEVLIEAKAADIPVFLTDRSVDVDDESLFVTFIGSDFVEEGRRAGEWLARVTDGTAVIAELQGTPGAAPAIDRRDGFAAAIAKHPGMRIVKTQSGHFNRSKGQEVFESFLRSPDGPSITALYAHNDDMALGAIQAAAEAGRAPGKDLIIVSIDGVRDAFVAMREGTLNCSIECNPLIGPLLFDLIEQHRAGSPIAKRVRVDDELYEAANVTDEVVRGRAY